MSTVMIDATTREMWLKTVQREVVERMVLPALLLERRKLTVRGGKSIKRTVQHATGVELAQDYSGGNEALRGGSKDTLTTVDFKWKQFQVPIEYEWQDEAFNAGGSDTAPVDLVQEIVSQGHENARLKLLSAIYSYPSSTSDSDKGFQGLTDALRADYTYGGVARGVSAGTNPWWQPGLLAASATDHQTEITASLPNLRAMMAVVLPYMKPGQRDAIALCGADLFNSIRSQMETAAFNPRFGQGKAFRYGFDDISLDWLEIIHEPYFDTQPLGSSTYYDTKKWFLLLNLSDWELRLFPGRDLKTMTPFKFQGESVNGFDKYLARIFVAGNLVCWRPQTNMWRANMVA